MRTFIRKPISLRHPPPAGGVFRSARVFAAVWSLILIGGNIAIGSDERTPRTAQEYNDRGVKKEKSGDVGGAIEAPQSTDSGSAIGDR